MFKWLRKLFGRESEADIVADMNAHAKDYLTADKAHEYLKISGLDKPNPWAKDLVTYSSYVEAMHEMAPIPRPPMKPTVHVPIKDDDDDDLLGLGIAAVEVGIDMMSGGGASDDTDVSSSESWTGGGGDFDGGGASGDW